MQTHTKKTAPTHESTSTFPIVGIGASAGGLEALEGLFASIPDDSGMAFVIIQHLAPDHESMMGDLLHKYTNLPTLGIQDGMALEANHIYLNPPGKNVNMLHGVFQLTAPLASHRQNLPIDAFFGSLAEDQGRNAIGIILSGTGSDGTLGLKAIKDAGGMTIVQDIEQAQYSGMPTSAINAGVADMVLPVGQIFDTMQNNLERPDSLWHATPGVLKEQTTLQLQKIFALLRSKLGHDFSSYKETTIQRRIERRMVLHRLETIDEYVNYLQNTPEEIRHLFKDLLIGVTSFFRDPEAFETLKETMLPAMLAGRPANVPIRVWVPGCSTGEEAYSLAMLLVEMMDMLGERHELQIFASDLDRNAIEFARNATYPESIAVDVPPERLRRFFNKDEGVYILKKQIRELVIFAEQNLIKDPPFSKLDLVSCRNLLIYLKTSLQKKILPMFHYTLNPKGLLFLGNSESIGEFQTLFSPLDQKSKIFQRKERIGAMNEYTLTPFFEDHPAIHPEPKPAPVRKADIRNLVEKIIIEDYAPPCVIVNEQQQILYFWGHTDRYLQAPSGEAVFNILMMARQGLKQKLKNALSSVARHKHPERYEGLRVKQNGGFHTLDLVVRPLPESAFPPGSMLVLFYGRDVDEAVRTSVKKSSGKEELEPQIETLQLELQTTRESLQTTIEELETSNEELKSTNEELQSVNEELQSSNEELKTSKEELQSTNEELTTVNIELQTKVDELSHANNDINNLLASTDIGTIFLDIDLRIKRFTPAITKIFHLIKTDIDRPISDIASNLDYNMLYDDAKAVLDTLDRKELEVQQQTEERRWYSMRIAPYRTLNNIIDGVVVTFVDITEMKRAESQRAARIYFESIVGALREPLIILDAELKVKSANPAFYRSFQVSQAKTQGKNIYELGDRQWDIPGLRKLLEEIIPQNSSFDDYEVTHDFPGLGRRTMRLNARRIEQYGSQPPLILLAFEGVMGNKEKNS